MIVRNLRPSDVENTAILMGYYKDDLGIADEDWDGEMVVKSLRTYAIGADHSCLLALDGTRVVGGLFGSVKTEFYNTQVTAVVHFIFLLESHRTQANYEYLFNEFKKWTDRFGAKKFLMVDITDNSRRLQDIAEVLEFDKETATLFIKEVE